MIFDAWDVVVARFPFSDVTAAKVRPALVLSSPGFSDDSAHVILAMITTAKSSTWPSDVTITDLGLAGLASPSIVRMKIFTLDLRVVPRKIGMLGLRDRQAVETALRRSIAPISRLP